MAFYAISPGPNSGGQMKRVSQTSAVQLQKTMLKGGLAAAAPGIVALTAAFTAPVSILEQYSKMGNMGVAALGVIFLGAAFYFSKGHQWAGIPAIAFTGWALFAVAQKAGRLLMLYYSHNPIVTLKDVFAPFPFISLQLTLVFIAGTIAYILVKTFLACRSIAAPPVNRMAWGAMGLWGAVVILDCMNKF